MAKRSQLFMLPLTEAKPPSVLTVLTVVLLGLYSPFAWIAILPGPWDAKRFLWLKSWPALPGFIVQSLDLFEAKPLWLSYGSMGLVTLLAFGVFFKIGRANRSWLAVSFVLAAAFSGWNSWLAYQVF